MSIQNRLTTLLPQTCRRSLLLVIWLSCDLLVPTASTAVLIRLATGAKDALLSTTPVESQVRAVAADLPCMLPGQHENT